MRSHPRYRLADSLPQWGRLHTERPRQFACVHHVWPSPLIHHLYSLAYHGIEQSEETQYERTAHQHRHRMADLFFKHFDKLDLSHGRRAGREPYLAEGLLARAEDGECLAEVQHVGERVWLVKPPNQIDAL